MKYSSFERDDFTRDEYFKSWVIAPDEDSDLFWTTFLEHHPDKVADIQIAADIIRAMRFTNSGEQEMTESLKDELFDDILSISKDISGRSSAKNGGFYQLWTHSWWTAKAAAILLLGVVSAIFWHQLVSVNSTKTAPPVHSMILKQTAPGSKLTVTLPDGSVVKLNSGSSLSYPEVFTDKRSVVLHGEAFFEVKEDPSKPFLVQTGEVITRVLGTSFNVEERANLKNVNVAVLTGKVEVKNKSGAQTNTKILSPDEILSIDLETSKMSVESFEYDSVFGWKDDLLYFKDANIDDIWHELEKWYGVEFDVQKKINKDKDFSGSYRSKSLSVVLEGIGFAFGFEYEIEGQYVIIK